MDNELVSKGFDPMKARYLVALVSNGQMKSLKEQNLSDVAPTSSNIYNRSKYCTYCKKNKNRMAGKCSKCGMAWYCSATCQRAHWKNGHKQECKRLKNSKQTIKKRAAPSSLSSSVSASDHFTMGEKYRHQEKFKKAAIEFRQCIDMNNENGKSAIGATTNCAQCLIAAGDVDGAFDILQDGLCRWPTAGSLYGVLGETFIAQGKWPDAIKVLKQAEGMKHHVVRSLLFFIFFLSLLNIISIVQNLVFSIY